MWPKGLESTPYDVLNCSVFRPLSVTVSADPAHPEWGNIISTDPINAVFKAIERLYLSSNTDRDRRIADRLTRLHHDALAEGESIRSASVEQFTDFFLHERGFGFPRITLTPDGALRVRWIAGVGNFTAIEFLGGGLVRFVAEIPRNGSTAQYYVIELTTRVAQLVSELGAATA